MSTELWRTKKINNISEVDPEDITLANLVIIFNSANHEVNGRGHERTVTYRLGYATKIGNIEKTCWSQLARQAIQKELPAGTYEQMRDFLTGRGVDRQYAEEDFEIQVLSACVSYGAKDPKCPFLAQYAEFCANRK